GPDHAKLSDAFGIFVRSLGLQTEFSVTKIKNNIASHLKIPAPDAKLTSWKTTLGSL
ncbi:hypothetical protein L9F63_016522, partial [Diploptera punctata]